MLNKRTSPTFNRPFDPNHWFNQRAVMLFNAQELRNQAFNRSVATVPTFDSAATFFAQGSHGRHVRKGTVDDGKGINFGSDSAQQVAVGTWLFVFSVDSASNYTNLWCNSQAGGAVGLLIRMNNNGTIHLIHINTADFYGGSIVLEANKIHTVAVSYSNTTGTGLVCINGKFDTAISTSSGKGFTYDTVRLCSGGVASFDGANRMYMAGMIPYTTDAVRLQNLCANPYQLLMPTPKRTFLNTIAAGGAFNPYWAINSNQLIQPGVAIA